MLAIGKELVAFAGKSGIYFRSLTGTSPEKSIDPVLCKVSDINLSEEVKEKNAHVECIAVSLDDQLIAIADSLHGLRLYEQKQSVEGKNLEWSEVFQRESTKRIVKLQFTSDRQYLTYLDKQGDIYAIRLMLPTKDISNAKKIMGHTSFISDFSVRVESSQIISCDRDEKIRISNFPDAYIIQGFKLGHTESVIGLSIVGPYDSILAESGTSSNSSYLLSVSVTGVLMLWDLKSVVLGTETDVIKRWNIKDLLPEALKEEEVKAMRVSQSQDSLHLCFIIGGSCTKVNIFKISIPQLTLELIQELEIGSNPPTFIDWGTGGTLIVYNPQVASLRCLRPGQTLLDQVSPTFSENLVADIKASVEDIKPAFVPMKKRQTSFKDHSVTIEEIQSKKIKA